MSSNERKLSRLEIKKEVKPGKKEVKPGKKEVKPGKKEIKPFKKVSQFIKEKANPRKKLTN